MHLHLAGSSTAQVIKATLGVSGDIAISIAIYKGVHSGAIAVQDGSILGGARAAPWMPDGPALQEHLLTISEWVAALGATSARWVEVVIFTSLNKQLRNINKKANNQDLKSTVFTTFNLNKNGSFDNKDFAKSKRS